MTEPNTAKATQEPAAPAAPGDTRIENLLETANEAAGAARNAWLGFILVMAYLLVTIASTGHRDLLLNDPVTLPIVDVELPLTSFYVYAPLLFWLLHLGLFIQHAVTAKKLNALKSALEALRGQRPPGYGSEVRSRLHHYSFAQYLAGAYGNDFQPENDADRTSAIHRGLMRLILWTSFVILPGLTFLYFQIGFLPYHDTLITWWQRILLIADVALLWAFWPIIRYDRPRWWDCFRSYPWRWIVLKAFATVAIVFLSLFVATLPDEAADRAMAGLWPAERRDDRRIFRPTAWLFEGEVREDTLRPQSLFSRNLVVVLEDLVDDERNLDEHEVSLSLRGRDLRYAFLSASDLHRADLAHANLEGANLINTDLRDATLHKADLRHADLTEAVLDGAQLRYAELRGAYLSGVSARGADLSYAKLQGSELGEADLRTATLRGASMEGANLDKTDLRGGELVYARLHGANLGGARLGGADLRRAHLQGADLKDADLTGADLESAHLEGAKLLSANLASADLRSARLWAADFPQPARRLELADLWRVDTTALSEEERDDLELSLERALGRGETHDMVTARLDHVLASPATAWTDRERWEAALAERAVPSPRDLGASLAALVCGDTEGPVAAGVLRRMLRKGGAAEAAPVFAERLLAAPAEDCAGRAHLSPGDLRGLRRLKAEAGAARQ